MVSSSLQYLLLEAFFYQKNLTISNNKVNLFKLFTLKKDAMASINIMKGVGDWLNRNNFYFDHMQTPYRVFVRQGDNLEIGVCLTYNKMFTKKGADGVQKDADLRDFNEEVSSFEIKK